MIELIPAIDLIDGKCVRLTKGDYDTKKVYNEDPLEVALELEDNGMRRLHVVDLDGARAGHIVNYHTLERLATRTELVIDFGGGLKSDDDLRMAFECGARMVTGGSVAVREPKRFAGWLECYGGERVILGADARDGRIAVGGWQETTDRELIPFLTDYMKQGVSQAICTDIARDGTLEGPSTALYREILGELPRLRLIASGGVSSVDDIERLQEAGLAGVIFGKALYEGRIVLRDLRPYLDKQNDKNDMPC